MGQTLILPLQNGKHRLLITGQESKNGKGGQRDLFLFSLKKSASFSICNTGAQGLASHSDLWMMLPEQLVNCFGKMAKESRVETQGRVSSQVRFVIRQMKSVRINWSWLARVLQRFLRLHPCSLKGSIWFYLPTVQVGQRHPHLNSTMASGTQEAESCCRRGKYDLVLKKHPIEWDKGKKKSYSQFPYEK